MADVPAFAAAYTGADPDYVLVNLGTNDMADIRATTLTEGNWVMDDLLDAIREGAVLRVRPKAMTVCARILRMNDVAELEAEVSRYADEHYGRAAA